MRSPIKAPPKVVKNYWQLFVNRRAYTMQSMRPHPETGRHYYFRPSKEGTDVPLMLTEETIRRHLEGKITVGLYAINPSTQRCKWVAIDADYKNSMEDLLKLQYHLTQDGVEPALEMSKRGGHLWIFLATPLLAKECRIYIHDLALKLGVPVKGAGLADGIEVFPKHDAIGAGEFGNAIRGPLGIHRGANRRFWFYGADYTLEHQIAYLNGLRKVTEEELRRYIAGKERPAAVASSAPGRTSLRQRRHRPGESDFRILAHVGGVRKVGRNYITRCPSCADSGHDRVGDNLAILIEDPRFYKCWAGCTKEMIRAALGCPDSRPEFCIRSKESDAGMKQKRLLDQVGLRLSRQALRVLKERGIFAHSPVSLEHQHLAKRYVVRGLESGGAAGDLGRYVTFARDDGQAIECLHPVEAIGVNGLHAVVVAPVLVRIEMLRKNQTYELLITQHRPGKAGNGKRPALETKALFRGIHGRLELDLSGKDKNQAGVVSPTFYSLGGEEITIPQRFQEVTRTITAAVHCVGCSHSHFVRASR